MIAKAMDVKKLMFAVLSAAAFVLASVSAHAAETPNSLEGTTLINADKAKELHDKGVAVIDSRVANEFAEAHIKGAISVPYKEKSAKAVDFDASQDSFDLSKLPADKNAPVIVYCNAGECWKSYKAAKAMVKAGYKKVYWFRGGFPEWKAKGYPTE